MAIYHCCAITFLKCDITLRHRLLPHRHYLLYSLFLHLRAKANTWQLLFGAHSQLFWSTRKIFLSEQKIKQVEAIIKITCTLLTIYLQVKDLLMIVKVLLEYICAHLQAAVNGHFLFSAFTLQQSKQKLCFANALQLLLSSFGDGFCILAGVVLKREIRLEKPCHCYYCRAYHIQFQTKGKNCVVNIFANLG